MTWIRIDPEELKQATHTFLSYLLDFENAEKRAYATVQGPGLGHAGPAAAQQMNLSTQAANTALMTQVTAVIQAIQQANALLASEQTPPAAAVPVNAPVTVIGQTVHGMSARPAWTQGLTDEQLLDGATTDTTGRIPQTTLSNGVVVLWSRELGPLIQSKAGLTYLNGNRISGDHGMVLEHETVRWSATPPPVGGVPLPSPSRTPTDQNGYGAIGLLQNQQSYDTIAKAQAQLDANKL